MTNAMAGELRRRGIPALTAGVLGSIAAGTSCIIPDRGIVALVDCGVRWCATAEWAASVDEVKVVVLRDGVRHERTFVRGR